MSYYLCSTCSCEWESNNKVYAEEKCPSCGQLKPITLVGKTPKDNFKEFTLTTSNVSKNWENNSFGKKIITKITKYSK